MALLKVDVKDCLYPPEILPVASSVNLLSGDNNMVELTSLKARYRIVTLMGVSSQNANATMYVLADEIEELRTDLNAVRGIDYNDEVRIPATDSMLIKVYSTSIINDYQSRFLFRVDKSTPMIKKYLNVPLDSRDIELLSKYNISEIKASEFNPYEDDVYKISTVSTRLTSSGTVLREKVRNGRKITILDISVLSRPDSPNVTSIVIRRDGATLQELDAYCLPTISLSNGARYMSTCKITAVDDIEVYANTTAETKIRVVYMVSRLSIEEKVKWDLKLTAEENKIAEQRNLFELAELGLI